MFIIHYIVPTGLNDLFTSMYFYLKFRSYGTPVAIILGFLHILFKSSEKKPGTGGTT